MRVAGGTALSLKAKLLGLGGLVVAVSAWSSTNLTRTTDSVVRSFRDGAQTAEKVSAESRHLLACLGEMEVAHRTYLLMGDEELAQQFSDARLEFKASLESISRSFASDQALLREVERIEHLQNKWLGLAAQPEIEMRKMIRESHSIENQIKELRRQSSPNIGGSISSALRSMAADMVDSDQADVGLSIVTLQSKILEARAEEAAFLLTGDRRHLAKYYAATTEISKYSADLEAQLAGDAASAKRLADVVSQIKTWTESSAQPSIDLRVVYQRNPQTMQDLQSLVRSGEGETTLPRIRGVVEKIARLVEAKIQTQIIASAEKAKRARRSGFLMTGLGILVLISIGFVIGRPMFRSLTALTKGADAIGAGDLDRQIPIRTNDEIGRLATAFNEMATKLKESTVSREYVERILYSMPNTIIVVDLESRISLVNQAAQNLFGHDEVDLLALPADRVFTEELDTGLSIGGWIERLAEADGEIESVETVGRDKDGQEIALIISGASIQDSAGHVEGVILAVEDIRERIEAEAQRLSLEEKELLLREIHHRVKNNMQIISSLLSLGGTSSKNPDFARIVRESQNRIRALALVHEKLYHSENLARIDFNDYLLSLAGDLFRSYRVDSSRVSFEVDTPDVILNMDSAVPCGLVVAELISNALKHAFPDGRAGKLRIYFGKREGGEYQLIVEDDGVGMDAEIDLAQAKSLGLRLVRDLVTHQLDGTISCRSSPDEGTVFDMQFKQLIYQPRLKTHARKKNTSRRR